MAVLISGIGRSGTTTVYQILGKGFLNKFGNAKCSYEPYLWNIPQVEKTAVVKGQPFSMEQVGLFNKYVHCKTPLFLSGRNALHDQWLTNVFGPVSPFASIAPNSSMAKVIRGAGRLEAALSKYKNLKVVIITRNIIDTANSGLGLFSFFGDEFHPSDKGRFIVEVNDRFGENFDINEERTELEWSTLWWYYLTEASIRTYEKFSDRIKLIPYEVYVQNKEKYMLDIFHFCKIEEEYLDRSLLDRGAGPTTSISYLTPNDLSRLKPEMEWYFCRLSGALNMELNFAAFTAEQRKRYADRKYIKSLLYTKPTNLTAVQWRIHKRNELIQELDKNSTSFIFPQFSVSAAQAEYGKNTVHAKSVDKNFKSKSTIGVLITTYNNENSIVETLYSVLNQTKLPDEIVVADDCSNDNTVNIVRSMKERFSQISLIARPANVGVSANRDLAIREMQTDFITTLDGDDLIYPEKLEIELNAVGGDKSKVGFSDIVVVTNEKGFIQRTEGYCSVSCSDMLLKLLSRTVPVPRDMLFSKEIFLKAEGFDVGMNIYEDWAFKMRLMNVSGNNNWVHSGGIGTIYDRRFPGLSGKPRMEHAYGQLLAISRNSKLFIDRPEATIEALTTVAKFLDKGLLERMSLYIDSIKHKHVTLKSVISKLSCFWESATFRDDIEYKFQQIWKFTV